MMCVNSWAAAVIGRVFAFTTNRGAGPVGVVRDTCVTSRDGPGCTLLGFFGPDDHPGSPS
jgi:hypothetical protein